MKYRNIRPDILAQLLVGLYIFSFGLISILKYNSFRYDDFDLAVHAQTLYNILHGSLESSILGVPFLGNHLNFILFLIAPIYAIFRSPLTLLLLQTAALGLSGYPIYLIAKEQLPKGLSLALFIKKVYKIHYYVFLRGIDVPGFYGGRFSFLNKICAPIIKHIWNHADIIIANSQSLKELANKRLNKKPIYVIPNGIDIDVFKPLQKDKDEGTKKILLVGRLSKQKGIDDFLEAIARIKKMVTAVLFSKLQVKVQKKSD
jgi:glycosyltransferase involved in cell wall biosynthesis